MKDKTIDQLKIIAKDQSFQSSEKRLEALIELDNRSALDPELKIMKVDIESSFVKDKKEKSFMETDKGYKEDGIVPLLYSKTAIYRFSFLFTVFVGSILLAINLARIKKAWQGILMTILNSILMFIILGFASIITYLSLTKIMILNGVIGYISMNYYWNRYIGKDIKYDKNSITIPLIICILISIVIILIYYSNYNFIWQDII